MPQFIDVRPEAGGFPRKKVIRIRIRVVKVSMEANCPITPVENATMRWPLSRFGSS